MSLKHVHTVFIVAVVALASVCAAQALRAFRASGAPSMALATLCAGVVAVLLVVYEKRFLDRCRQEGIR